MNKVLESMNPNYLTSLSIKGTFPRASAAVIDATFLILAYFIIFLQISSTVDHVVNGGHKYCFWLGINSVEHAINCSV